MLTCPLGCLLCHFLCCTGYSHLNLQCNVSSWQECTEYLQVAKWPHALSSSESLDRFLDQVPTNRPTYDASFHDKTFQQEKGNKWNAKKNTIGERKKKRLQILTSECLPDGWFLGSIYIVSHSPGGVIIQRRNPRIIAIAFLLLSKCASAMIDLIPNLQ